MFFALLLPASTATNTQFQDRNVKWCLEEETRWQSYLSAFDYFADYNDHHRTFGSFLSTHQDNIFANRQEPEKYEKKVKKQGRGKSKKRDSTGYVMYGEITRKNKFMAIAVVVLCGKFRLYKE